MHKRTIILMSSTLAACAAAIALLWLLGGGLSASAAPIINAPAAELQVCPSGCTYSSVQAAVDAAGPGDVIKVAQGTYTDIHVRAGITQVVYISKTVTVRGGYNAGFTAWDPTAHPTTLDAQGQGRVLYLTGNITPTIEGLRITGGDARGFGSSWSERIGGGIYVGAAYATAVISDNIVYSNTAVIGGGIGLYHHSPAILNGNTVISNTAEDGGGVGVVLWSAARLNNNTISGNKATGSGWGGGLSISSSPASIVNGNLIYDNSGYTGGGVSLDGSGNVILSNNTIYNNTATDGGGLYLNWSNARLDNNVITSNSASVSGGGLNLNRSDATLVNNFVADNQAAFYGSGIYITRSSPRLLHTTIARNSYGDGTGVYVTDDCSEYSSVAMTNTIIFSHTVGITVTAGNKATLNATLWHANDMERGGAGAINHINDHTGDPAFAGPGYHLTGGSAAIDAGIDAGVTTDLEGDARPIGAAYDIGADETAARYFIYLPLVVRG